MITFDLREDGLYAVRLADIEIIAGHGREFTVIKYAPEIVVPCDGATCPHDEDPDDLDACVKECPYQYQADSHASYDARWGDEIDLDEEIRTFRVDVLSGRKNSLGKAARAFATFDWQLGDVVYEATAQVAPANRK